MIGLVEQAQLTSAGTTRLSQKPMMVLPWPCQIMLSGQSSRQLSCAQQFFAYDYSALSRLRGRAASVTDDEGTATMNAPVHPGEFRTDDGSTPAERYSRLPESTWDSVKHLPGEPPVSAARIVLNTVRFLADPLGTVKARVAEHGRVYRNQNFGMGWQVALIGPDANELVFMNRDKMFSSEQGWNPVLQYVFPRGVMLMDFEEHRVHRKTLSIAFKPAPMQHYLGQLQEGIARRVERWPVEVKFYPAIKQLTLDLAATSFLGIPWGPEAERINKAFVDMVLASVGIVRRPLPFTAMRRGVKGRAFMCEFFAREIPKRRGKSGEDIFTQICNAEHEDETSGKSRPLTDQEVIDHMNFLMMAAHDTLTSSLTSTVYYLGKSPVWQETVRTEVEGVRSEFGDSIPYGELDRFEKTEWAFKEAMRLVPPVPALPRRALKDFTFGNYTIPAGTHIGVNPMMTHRLPEYWPDPERFDPSRFSDENSKGRHKYAWVPFGGGGHMCLGLHFAYMQEKAFFFELLHRRRIVLPDDYEADFAMFPIPRPKDGLPVRFEKI
jgi:cytochrome P450